MANILVIEDTEEIRALLLDFLTEEGHVVQLANDGEIGCKMLGETHYDIVITDILMPNKEGLQTIMAIKEMEKRPVVIAMSGGSKDLGIEFLMHSAKAFGAAYTFTKPLDLAELANAVNEIVSDGT